MRKPASRVCVCTWSAYVIKEDGGIGGGRWSLLMPVVQGSCGRLTVWSTDKQLPVALLFISPPLPRREPFQPHAHTCSLKIEMYREWGYACVCLHEEVCCHSDVYPVFVSCLYEYLSAVIYLGHRVPCRPSSRRAGLQLACRRPVSLPSVHTNKGTPTHPKDLTPWSFQVVEHLPTS